MTKWMANFSEKKWTKNENLHVDKFEFTQKDINGQNFWQKFNKIQVFSILGSHWHFCHNLPQCLKNCPYKFQFTPIFAWKPWNSEILK